ncbi:hypothetical protein [Hespellia stercorisuis]|uniref:Uncharacterized protein n=1 Tax=Hespellia stercorisuis DSM 15480 TaxID=1121950 RepID=A0A1M6WE39_9FIRM|nr:hypothetical protein [Hespellia stercorisuis]SHK92042.1 hypothetical protein SAMN02745243_03998 [Hespellia stercorisuis DSM 15480]
MRIKYVYSRGNRAGYPKSERLCFQKDNDEYQRAYDAEADIQVEGKFISEMTSYIYTSKIGNEDLFELIKNTESKGELYLLCF